MISRRKTTGLALVSVLALGVVSCGDKPEDEPQSNLPKAREEPLPFRMTPSQPPELPGADSQLAANTLPESSDDALPPMFGVESGRLLQVYKGDRTGARETIFRKYGNDIRVSDSSFPVKAIDPAPPIHTLRITTPEFIRHYDFQVKQGWRTPNRSLAPYFESGAADSMGVTEFMMRQIHAEKLPDTTINGYKTSVYRFEAPGETHTLWLWRGIVLREHVFAPMDDIEFRLEPVSLEVNTHPKDDQFRMPETYRIVDRNSPPMPSALPPPPMGNEPTEGNGPDMQGTPPDTGGA